MPNGDYAAEFARLKRLPERAFLTELTEAVQEHGELMALMPQTVPPAPFAQYSLDQQVDMTDLAMELAIERDRGRLYDIVCVKLRYCSLKKNVGDEIDLLVQLLTALLGIVQPWLTPIPIVILYAFKKGKFDRLCNCPHED